MLTRATQSLSSTADNEIFTNQLLFQGLEVIREAFGVLNSCLAFTFTDKSKLNRSLALQTLARDNILMSTPTLICSVC